jgi:hypothetical protein
MHYLRDDYKLHNVVLTLRDTLGSHTSENIADHLFDVLKDYQISSSQIAFFAADNATNNDKALKLLSDHVSDARNQSFELIDRVNQSFGRK